MNPRALRGVLAVLTAGLLLLGAAARAETPAHTPEHLAAARELVTLVSPTGALEAQARALAGQLVSDPRLAAYEDVFHQWLMDIGNPENVHNAIAGLYADHFTEGELRDIIKFYKSKTGRKVVQEMPSLTEQSIRLGEEWAFRSLPKLVEMLRERHAEELQKQRQQQEARPPADEPAEAPPEEPGKHST